MKTQRWYHLGVSVASVTLGCQSPTTQSTDPLATPNGVQQTHPGGVVTATAALGGQPYGLAISAAGDLLVAQVFGDSVTRFALPGTSPVSASYFGQPGAVTDSGTAFTLAGTVHVALNPAGTTAYVVEQFGNAVGVLDLTSNTITTSIPLTNSGFNIIVAPDGQRAYASTADGRIYVIATSTNTIVDSMVVGPAANGFAISPDGSVLYASSRDFGTVTAFRTADDARLSTIIVGGRPQRLAVSPDGVRLYAANEDSGLTVVNLEEGRVLPSVNPLGSGYGLGLTPDGAQLYLTDPLSGRLAILDRSSLGTLGILRLGGEPRNVAFGLEGTIGVVTDGNGRVIFIR
jgi:DNA-binding beta-propeller fold protein YncE